MHRLGFFKKMTRKCHGVVMFLRDGYNLPMKIRTIYFKVTDMQKAVAFWRGFLGIEPHKQFDEWHEFMAGNARLGLLLSDEKPSGSKCVPVFEFTDQELPGYIERAKSLGATVIEDGLSNPDLLSVVFADPWGNEFEASKFHD